MKVLMADWQAHMVSDGNLITGQKSRIVRAGGTGGSGGAVTSRFIRGKS